MDMRFGTLNVTSLYRAGALDLVSSKMEKSRIKLVGIQEVRWEGNGCLESGNHVLLYGVVNGSQLGTEVFVHSRIRSTKNLQRNKF